MKVTSRIGVSVRGDGAREQGPWEQRGYRHAQALAAKGATSTHAQHTHIRPLPTHRHTAAFPQEAGESSTHMGRVKRCDVTGAGMAAVERAQSNAMLRRGGSTLMAPSLCPERWRQQQCTLCTAVAAAARYWVGGTLGEQR